MRNGATKREHIKHKHTAHNITNATKLGFIHFLSIVHTIYDAACTTRLPHMTDAFAELCTMCHIVTFLCVAEQRRQRAR